MEHRMNHWMEYIIKNRMEHRIEYKMEHRTEKRMKIKKEYDRIREDPPSCNIQIRTLGNYGSKLETIIEDELSF